MEILSVRKFLDDYFSEIPLQPPLYYNSKIGLRFELGIPNRGIDYPDYFTNVNYRASRIFEKVFEDAKDIGVVIKKF